MIEENKLIFGILFVIFGCVFLYFNFNNDDYEKERAWDIAMIFRGLVGGLAFIAIGLVLLLMEFEIL